MIQSARDSWIHAFLGVDPADYDVVPVSESPQAAPATSSPNAAHAPDDASKPTFTLDKDKAAAYLTAHATAKTSERCGHYVRMALLAGGLDIEPVPAPAKEFGPSLISHGFAVVGQSDSITPMKGDVAVIQNYPGGNVNGHVAMFNGTEWISDFRQRDVWGGPGFRQAKPAIRIYRHA